jgi:uncharacterized protein YsxB (DUF464 family)
MLTQNGRPAGFEVTGHAGCSAYGRDIVCSAVSAIAQTALLGLTDVLGLPVRHQSEAGRLYCGTTGLSAAQSRDAALILNTMLAGLEAILMNEEYQQYLSITQREV